MQTAATVCTVWSSSGGNPSGLYAPFLVGSECLTTKPIYSSAQRFHDGKISGYSSTLPEKLSDDEEVNP
jgi:hypothetical protein